MENHESISAKQLFCLLWINLMGTSLLKMPREAAIGAGRDGWLSILIGGLLAAIYGTGVSLLVRNHPKETLVEIIEKRWGRIAAVLVGFFFWIFLVLLTSAEFRTYVTMTRLTLLEKTPVTVILLTMLGVVLYAALKGYECRGRLAEITLVFITLPLLLLIAFSITQVNIYEWGPLLTADEDSVILTGCRLSLLYFPVCLLQMGGGYMGKEWRGSVSKTVYLAIGVTTVLNLVLFFISIGCLGSEMTEASLWPLMQVMMIVDIPILEIERQDVLLMTFWILAEFTLLASYVFHGGLLWQKISRQKQKTGCIVTAAVVLVLSMPAMDILRLFSMDSWIYGVSGILFLILSPWIFSKEPLSHV